MQASLLLAGLGLLVVVAWVIASSRTKSPRSPEVAAADDDAIDRAALEQAEREVKDMEGGRRGEPTDDVVGDDWGPGSPRPPFG